MNLWNFELDEYWFLCSSNSNLVLSSKNINFKICWIDFLTNEKDFVVYYKRKLSEKNIKEIWNGMQIFRFIEDDLLKLNPNFNLSKTDFLNWLSIYREFDEIEGKNNAYIYKFPKDNLDELEFILNSIWFKWLINLKWKYIKLNIDIGNNDDVFIKLKKDIIENNITSIFSFFYWLVLSYWNLELIWNSLNNVSINLPVISNILSNSFIIEDLLNYLKSKWYLFDFSKIKNSIWFTYQILIQDEVFLDFIIKNLPKKFELINWKKISNNEYIKLLIKNWLSKNLTLNKYLKVYKK